MRGFDNNNYVCLEVHQSERLTFKLSIAFFILKDKRSITFGSFEKQACRNISFFAQILPAEEKFLKVVVGAQNVSDKQGSNMLQTITGMGFFVKINRQTAQSHASNLKLRQSLTNRAVML